MVENYIEYNLKLGYKNVYDKTFAPLCQGVVANLTDNANFPNVGSVLTELTAAVEDYIAAIPTKLDKSPAKVTIKDEKRMKVKLLMRKAGFYVLLESDNDLTKLESSGFEMAKIYGSSTLPELPMPVLISMTTNGTPRQLIVKCKAAKAARLYDVRTSVDKVNWSTVTNDSSKVIINNLTPEVIIYVQIRYRNTEHETPWSSTVETRIFDTAIAMQTAN